MREYVKRFLMDMIRGYQLYISGLHPGCCRYTPTCSNYALEAVARFGVAGLLLGLWRVLRCNPFSRGGYDPVPATFSFRKARNKNERETSDAI